MHDNDWQPYLGGLHCTDKHGREWWLIRQPDGWIWERGTVIGVTRQDYPPQTLYRALWDAESRMQSENG